MLSFGDFVFSKGGFLDDKNVDHFTIVENSAYISKGVKLMLVKSSKYLSSLVFC